MWNDLLRRTLLQWPLSVSSRLRSGATSLSQKCALYVNCGPLKLTSAQPNSTTTLQLISHAAPPFTPYRRPRCGAVLGKFCGYCHPCTTCFADLKLPSSSPRGNKLHIGFSGHLLARASSYFFNATCTPALSGWVKSLQRQPLWSSGKYVYSKRVKKQSRSRPTNHSIWLYHVLLNERFTHTDH